MIPLSDVPFDQIELGNPVISATGTNGKITGIFENFHHLSKNNEYIKIKWDTGCTTQTLQNFLTEVMYLERFDMIEFVNNSLIMDKARYEEFEKMATTSMIGPFDLVAIIDGNYVQIIKSRFFEIPTLNYVTFVEFKKLCDKYIK